MTAAPRQQQQPVDENTRQGVLFTAVLSLLCLVGYLLLNTSARGWALLLGASAGVLALFLLPSHLQPRHWRRLMTDWQLTERIADHLGVITGAVAVLFLVPALTGWWVVNYRWAADDALMVVASEPITRPVPDVAATGSLQLTLQHPQTALISNPPADLMVDLTSTGTLTAATPITLTVTLPAGLLITAPSSQEGLTEGVVELTQTDATRLRGSLSISNSATQRGIRRPADITLAAPFLTNGVMPSAITIEGQSGFAIRRFITTEINPNSPTIFLVGLLVPVLAAMMQAITNERRQELREKRKQEYNELWERLQERFRGEDLKGAEEIHQEMTKRRYHQLAVTEPEAAKTFVDFVGYFIPKQLESKPASEQESESASEQEREGASNGGREPASEPGPELALGRGFLDRMMTIHRRWPKLWTMAYVLAIKKFNEQDDRSDELQQDKLVELLKVREQATYVYLELEDDPQLQDRLAIQEYDDRIGGQRPRSVWPPPREERNYDRPADVFATDRAEQPDDMQLLWGGAFCGRTRICARLTRHSQSSIILGRSGSGRTALARKLPEVGFAGARVLGVYLSGPVSPSQIAAGVAQQMLAFIDYNPTEIDRMSTSQRELLAYVLATSLGAMSVKAKLARMQMESLRGEPQPTDPEAYRNAETKRRYLELLKRTVTALESRALVQATPSAEAERDLAAGLNLTMAECVTMLEFAHPLLVFDTAAEHGWWARELILRWAEVWNAAGIHFALFAPDGFFPMQPPASNHVKLRYLEWTEGELEGLVNDRFGRIPSLGSALGYLASPDLFSHMVGSVHYNPRALIRLWRELVGPNKEITKTIEESDIDTALGKIGV